MIPTTITTKRLRLMPHEPAHLRALIDGSEVYERISGLKAAQGLRDFIVSPDVSPEWREALENATGVDPWTYGFALVHLECGEVIGNASFTGPPDAAGVVEIAYGIVPEYEGRGYATEAAQALITYARDDRRVRKILAHTLPARNASTRVLEKCGLQRVGELTHPTDGLLWRWELPLGSR